MRKSQNSQDNKEVDLIEEVEVIDGEESTSRSTVNATFN